MNALHHHDLRDDHMLVLGVLRRSPVARPEQISEFLGISVEVVVELLSDLMDVGWVEGVVEQ